MKQIHIVGKAIIEHSGRDREIHLDIEEILNLIARAHLFNWTAPTHDIVRRLMNEVQEFKPAADYEP